MLKSTQLHTHCLNTRVGVALNSAKCENGKQCYFIMKKLKCFTLLSRFVAYVRSNKESRVIFHLCFTLNPYIISTDVTKTPTEE